jgi:tRNA isopentenyl-2-thiomethyl-A-37 hydroxylase MiaE
MTPPFRTLVTLCLGGFLLASAGCEDKAAQEALKTCKSDLGNEQKLVASQSLTINELKSQLAQVQAKVEEMTKENEAAKTAKGGKAMEEKAKPDEEKKAESAKGDKKSKPDKKNKK